MAGDGRHRVMVIIRIVSRHVGDQVLVLGELDLLSAKNSRIAVVTLAAVAGLRRCSRTMTRSHSSSNASVHTTVCRPSSLNPRRRSMTENGKRTFVSTKTRFTSGRRQ